MAGIMHFSNFFRWMEACESAFYRSLGLPLVSFVPGNVVGWPRVSARCDFKAPLRFNETAEVRLLIKEVRTRAVIYVFQFRKVGETGCVLPEIVAQGEIAAVCVTSMPPARWSPSPSRPTCARSWKRRRPRPTPCRVSEFRPWRTGRKS
jgi:YbgC/YbaW family acyl-CoA thioester hydrolase